jgi:phosphopantothenoylcysteine synthetase/decarboxylase
MRILITSGGTREYIDPVRFISNASTGKMGFALTSAALKAGHKVTLITTVKKANIKHQTCPELSRGKSKLRIVTVQTAAQMFEAVKKHFPKCDCLIMAAAVADYTPIRPAKTKIKKQDKVLTLRLKPTFDILKWAGRHKKLKIKDQRSKMWKGRRLVVGFALEDRNLRANAERKMREKNLDMIIVNTPESIGVDKTSAQIKMPGQKWLKIAKAGKTAVAEKVIILMEAIQERSDSCLAGKAQMR